LLLRENALIGHVAKANPIWRVSGAAVVIFNGVDAYVSPAWYPSKAETGKVVPTWNYVAVTVDVAVEPIHDAARKLEIVRALTDRHEAITGSGWSVDDAPVEFIDSNLKAIVGLELTIIQISGKAKLSQNRSPADRSGVAEALKDSPIGSLMT
jgi:transcriptional regulator